MGRFVHSITTVSVKYCSNVCSFSQCLPQNVFIIGACNPHRSNSVAMHEKVEESEECDWVKGSYYVHRLHPTVRCLLWNYGAPDEEQEERYIETKMKMAVSRYGSSTPLRGG